MEKKVAFIGLGNIGYFVAGNLSKAGFSVAVYNRTQEQAEKWQKEFGGTIAASIKNAVQNAEIILTCVTDDNAVNDVYFSEHGVINNLQVGSIVIDHSTVSVSISKKLSKAIEEKHGHFFDAPVSGGSIGAQKGTLAVMVGGSEANYESAAKIIEAYSASVKYIGPSGSGQLTKMVNQICTSANISAVAEGMALAKAAGLDQEVVVNAIKSGAAGSWMMENRSQFMINQSFIPGFGASLMLKDVKLTREHAESIGLDLPQLKLATERYQKLIDNGHGDEDMAAIYRLYQSV